MPRSHRTSYAEAMPAPNPLRPWPREHPWLSLTAIVLLLALIAGGGYWVTRPVLVTDGSHLFAPELEKVEGKIKKENARIDDSGRPFVTIAVMATMDPTPKDPLDTDYVKHALQGASQAQRERNEHGGLRYKLLLADDGSLEQHAMQTAKELESRASSDHLVAVTGLGISTARTWDVIKELDKHYIATIGADLSGFEYTEHHNFYPMAPTNSAQNKAAVDFLLHSDKSLARNKSKTLLVEAKDKRDKYNSTLTDSFRNAARHKIRVDHPRPFHPDVPSGIDEVQEMATGICNHSDVRAVYFAGRANSFKYFLEGLVDRGCDDPLTVITGVDAAQLTNDKKLPKLQGVHVYYTGEAFPRSQVDSNSSKVRKAEQDFIKGYTDDFPEDRKLTGLWDGWAIMYHDAADAGMAIAKSKYARIQRVPQASDVWQTLGSQAVYGVSGAACFEHRTVGKPVPIVELHAGKPPTTRKQPYWPEGEPPGRDACADR